MHILSGHVRGSRIATKPTNSIGNILYKRWKLHLWKELIVRQNNAMTGVGQEMCYKPVLLTVTTPPSTAVNEYNSLCIVSWLNRQEDIKLLARLVTIGKRTDALIPAIVQ